MRLTCPACGAAYDVPDDAIPATGREVECSDCGAVWRTRRAAAGASDQPADDRFAIERALARAVTADAAGDPAQAPAAPPLPDEDDDEEPPLPGLAPAPRRRPLDDSILRILREEAERETRARAAERAPVEIQPELGLPEGQPPRPAPSPPSAPAPDPKPSRAPAARPAAPPKPEEPAPRDSGFGAGFLLAIGLAATALYVYVAAAGIATEFPGLEPALASYLACVDTLRLWLAETAAALRAYSGI